MSPALALPAFVVGAVVSLRTSAIMARRIESVVERVGLSEALLGICAALAADAPEITSAIAAIQGHEARIGAGVVLGSAVFNLTALLGVGAVAAGGIVLHRKVIALGGFFATVVAFLALAAATGAIGAEVVVSIGVIVLGSYLVLLAIGDRGLEWLPAPATWRRWLVSAVVEEEAETEGTERPPPGGLRDAAVAFISLAIVVVASVVMERSVSSLGTSIGIPEIVSGALILGWATGLPNAVASTYLARRGRGAAALSTALNSNNFNIAIGLLVPAAVVGLGPRSSQTVFLAAWCLVLTAVTLAVAHRSSAVPRRLGVAVILAYIAFVISVLVIGFA
jgi:cation:H+ antiporter